MNSLKKVATTFTAKIVPEGDGARVRRIIGNSHVRRLDPFLMLDHATVHLPSGFPDHPHRGFETVTYSQKGSMQHEDSKGNKGFLDAGDCQWMTAGKGIIHAEMPASSEEPSVGFQLWINLAAKDKYCDPHYQEIKKDSIPVASKDGVSVKVIAGESLGQKGPIYARTPAIFLDVTIDKNSKFEQIIPKGWNVFSHVYEGQATFQHSVMVKQDATIVFEKDENELINIETGDAPAGLLLIAGKPLNEKVVQHGPFVLNTEEEIIQAFEDYRQGKNGFENSHEWESKIRHLAQRK